MKKTSTLLREKLATGNTMVKPGAFDALSAIMMERAGFECIGISGYALSLSLLGKPDIGFTSLTQVADACRRISDVVSVPVIADADTGYGNAVNAMYTVEQLIKAGTAGAHIEDQDFPKRCGHVSGKQIISVQEMVGKIRAVARVRDELDPDFVIIARTDVRGAAGGNFEQVIERSLRYVEAGADMIFPEGLTTLDELAEAAERIPVPLHYNRNGFGVSPLIPLEELRRLKIGMVSDATGSIRCVGEALWNHLTSLQNRDSEYLAELVQRLKPTPYGNTHKMSDKGMNYYLELEKTYLPSEDQKRYEGSLGFAPGDQQ